MHGKLFLSLGKTCSKPPVTVGQLMHNSGKDHQSDTSRAHEWEKQFCSALRFDISRTTPEP